MTPIVRTSAAVGLVVVGVALGQVLDLSAAARHAADYAPSWLGPSSGKSAQATQHASARPVPSARGAAGDQYELLAAIHSAEQGELASRDARLSRVRAQFRGRPVHWELAITPMLCRSADACVALPFDHARPDARNAPGFLPRLALDPASHRQVVEQCGADYCVIEVDADLTELDLSSDKPMRLGLDNVRVQSTRAPRVEESWARRPDRSA